MCSDNFSILIVTLFEVDFLALILFVFISFDFKLLLYQPIFIYLGRLNIFKTLQTYRLFSIYANNKLIIFDKYMKAIDRLYEYLAQKGLKPTAFEKEIGLSNGYFSAQKKRNADMGEGIMIKIIDYCRDINAGWLLTGKGDMFNQDNNANINDNLANAIPLNIESANMGKPIPLVHQFAAAGFGNADFSIGEQDVKEYYVIPKFKYSKVDFMIEVTGMSMYPHYTPGDVIACSILHDSQFIQWNKCHVIATQEQGIIVKRLMPGKDERHLKIISDNKEFLPVDVPLDEITGVALVVGAVSLE